MSSVNQPSPTEKLKGFAEFLESTPPGVSEELSDVCSSNSHGHRVIAEPDVQLHCSSDACQGTRFFQCTSDTAYLRDKGWKYTYLTYRCRNCRTTAKVYSIAVLPQNSSSSVGTAYKFGEHPSFGPPTPARVITLIGPDRELYLRGRRAENQGLGIGAFAYYRRVVENQKGRVIEEMGRVAKKLGASAKVVAEFDAAAAETQFSTAIARIKDAIPQSLMINGNNPLSLLHKALSEGLHEEDENVCLELAHSIRLVLTELAERMSQVLKDKVELDNAVTRLLNRKAEKSAAPIIEPEDDESTSAVRPKPKQTK